MKYDSSHPQQRERQKENKHRPDLKSSRATTNAVSCWLDEQSEVRGLLNAFIYTTHILSLFHANSNFCCRSDEVNWQKNQTAITTTENFCNIEEGRCLRKKKESKKSGGGNSADNKKPFDLWTNYCRLDSERIKRSAAVDCLMSASEQNCGIESLIDRLWEKLNSINDSINGSFFDNYGDRAMPQPPTTVSVADNGPSRSPASIKNINDNRNIQNSVSEQKFIMFRNKFQQLEQIMHLEEEYEHFVAALGVKQENQSSPLKPTKPGRPLRKTSMKMHEAFVELDCSMQRASSLSKLPSPIPPTSSSSSSSSSSPSSYSPPPSIVHEQDEFHLHEEFFYANFYNIDQWIKNHVMVYSGEDEVTVTSHAMAMHLACIQSEEELQLYDDLAQYTNESGYFRVEDYVHLKACYEPSSSKESPAPKKSQSSVHEEGDLSRLITDMVDRLLDDFEDDYRKEQMQCPRMMGSVVTYSRPVLPSAYFRTQNSSWPSDRPSYPQREGKVEDDEETNERDCLRIATEMALWTIEDDRNEKRWPGLVHSTVSAAGPVQSTVVPPREGFEGETKKKPFFPPAPPPIVFLYGDLWSENIGGATAAASLARVLPGQKKNEVQDQNELVAHSEPYEEGVWGIVTTRGRNSCCQIDNNTETHQWISACAVDLHLGKISQSLQQINHENAGPFRPVIQLPRSKQVLRGEEKQDKGPWSDPIMQRLPSTRQVKIICRSGDSSRIDVPVDSCTHFTPIKQESQYSDGTTFPIASDLTRIAYRHTPQGSMYVDNQQYRVYSPPPELFSQLGFQSTVPPRPSAVACADKITTKTQHKASQSSSSSSSSSSSHNSSAGAGTFRSSSAESSDHPRSSSSCSSFSSASSSHNNSSSMSSSTSSSPSDISSPGASNNIVEDEAPAQQQQGGCGCVNDEFRLKYAIRQIDVGCQTVTLTTTTTTTQPEVVRSFGTHDGNFFDGLLRRRQCGHSKTGFLDGTPEGSPGVCPVCGDLSEYGEFLQSMKVRKHETIPPNLQSFLQNECFSRQFFSDDGNTAAAGQRSKFFPCANSSNNNASNIGRISKTIWLIQASDPAPIMTVYDLMDCKDNNVARGGDNAAVAAALEDNSGFAGNRRDGPYCKICNNYVLNWEASYAQNAIWFDHESYKIRVCRQCQFRNSTETKTKRTDLQNEHLSIMDEIERLMEKSDWGEHKGRIIS